MKHFECIDDDLRRVAAVVGVKVRGRLVVVVCTRLATYESTPGATHGAGDVEPLLPASGDGPAIGRGRLPTRCPPVARREGAPCPALLRAVVTQDSRFARTMPDRA